MLRQIVDDATSDVFVVCPHCGGALYLRGEAAQGAHAFVCQSCRGGFAVSVIIARVDTGTKD